MQIFVNHVWSLSVPRQHTCSYFVPFSNSCRLAESFLRRTRKQNIVKSIWLVIKACISVSVLLAILFSWQNAILLRSSICGAKLHLESEITPRFLLCWQGLSACSSALSLLSVLKPIIKKKELVYNRLWLDIWNTITKGINRPQIGMTFDFLKNPRCTSQYVTNILGSKLIRQITCVSRFNQLNNCLQISAKTNENLIRCL